MFETKVIWSYEQPSHAEYYQSDSFCCLEIIEKPNQLEYTYLVTGGLNGTLKVFRHERYTTKFDLIVSVILDGPILQLQAKMTLQNITIHALLPQAFETYTLTLRGNHIVIYVIIKTHVPSNSSQA